MTGIVYQTDGGHFNTAQLQRTNLAAPGEGRLMDAAILNWLVLRWGLKVGDTFTTEATV